MKNKNIEKSIKLGMAALMLTGVTGCNFFSKKETKEKEQKEFNQKNDSTSKIVEKEQETKTEEQIKKENSEKASQATFENKTSFIKKVENIVNEHKEVVHNYKSARDTKAPTINVEDITVEFGVTPDFSAFTAVDNIDGNVSVSIIGNYNIKQAGVYPMVATAIDKDGNTARVSFNLVVNAHPRQGELDAAVQVMTDLYNKLVAAKASLVSAEAELQARKTVLASNENKKEELENKISALEAAVVSTTATLNERKAELAKAQQAYEEKLNIAEQSQEIKDANDLIKVAKAAIISLIGQKTVEQQNLELAKTELDNATKKYEDSKIISDAARSAVAPLKAEVDKLFTEKTQAENAYNEAKELVDRASAVKNSAKAEYDAAVVKATDSEEFRTARANLEKSVTDYVQAQANTRLAGELLDTANVQLETAKEEKSAADALVASTRAAKEEAEQRLATAKSKLVSAEEVLKNSTERREALKRDYDDALLAIAPLVTAKEEAEQRLATAEKAKEHAAQALADIEEAKQTAMAALADARAVISKGSLGFYEANGSEAAVTLMKDRLAYEAEHSEVDSTGFRRLNDGQGRDDGVGKFYGYGVTELGVKGDATSLENMKASIEFIKKANSYRTAGDSNYQPMNALLVTDYTMMKSQLLANAAAGIMDHTGITTAPGENIAGGYSGIKRDIHNNPVESDPFMGWYDLEKAIYDKGLELGYKNESEIGMHTAEIIAEMRKEGLRVPNSNIGHYTSLMDKDWALTGFAITDKKETSYRIIHEQSFYQADSQNRDMDHTKTKSLEDKEWDDRNTVFIYDNPVTIEEYEAKFNAYYEEVYTKLREAEAHMTEVSATYDELHRNEGLTDAEVEAINSAKKSVEETTAMLNASNGDVISKKEAYDAQAKVVEVDTQNTKALEDEKNAAAEEVNKKTAEAVSANENQIKEAVELEEAEENKTSAEEHLSEMTSAEEAAKNDVTDKQAVLDALNADVADKSKVLEAANEDLANKTNSMNEKNVALEAAKNKYDSANETYIEQDNNASELEATTAANEEDKNSKADKVIEVENAISTIDNTIAANEETIKTQQDIINEKVTDVKEAADLVAEKTAAEKTAAEDVNLALAAVEANNKAIEETAKLISENITAVEEATTTVEEKKEIVVEATNKYEDSVKVKDEIHTDIYGE